MGDHRGIAQPGALLKNSMFGVRRSIFPNPPNERSCLPGFEAGKVDPKRRSRQTVQHLAEVLARPQVEAKSPPDGPADFCRGFHHHFNRFFVVNPDRPAGQVPQRFKCNFHIHALSIAAVRHFDYYEI